MKRLIALMLLSICPALFAAEVTPKVETDFKPVFTRFDITLDEVTVGNRGI